MTQTAVTRQQQSATDTKPMRTAAEWCRLWLNRSAPGAPAFQGGMEGFIRAVQQDALASRLEDSWSVLPIEPDVDILAAMDKAAPDAKLSIGTLREIYKCVV